MAPSGRFDGIFRKTRGQEQQQQQRDVEAVAPPHRAFDRDRRSSAKSSGDGPTYNHNGHEVRHGVTPEGESGRRGFNPWQTLKICFRSSSTPSMIANILWPVVPAAIAVHFLRRSSKKPPDHLVIFILNYIAMIPSANLLGFAGQELARKLPHVLGIIMETSFGSIVEMILLIVLVITSSESHSLVSVIHAAILGSILANLLLCLGLCFFAGGMRRDEQEFHEAVSEVGSGLILVAGMGLLVPSAYFATVNGHIPNDLLGAQVLSMSRITAIFLLVAFAFYMWFQVRTHHGIYEEVLASDVEKDDDKHKKLKKAKLTLTECIFVIALALVCVSMHAVFLVLQIENIVKGYDVKDAFMGLILVPVIEKFAKHLIAIDEAWDNQMNFALAHVLGASIHTALLNAPLVVIIGWGLKKGMDLQFETFMIVVLVLAILVVGNFVRDRKSTYLEGALLVIVYMIISVAAWHFPNPPQHGRTIAEGGTQR